MTQLPTPAPVPVLRCHISREESGMYVVTAESQYVSASFRADFNGLVSLRQLITKAIEDHIRSQI